MLEIRVERTFELKEIRIATHEKVSNRRRSGNKRTPPTISGRWSVSISFSDKRTAFANWHSVNWGTKREEKRIKWIIADGNEWPFDYYDCAHARLPIHASFAIIPSLHPGFDGSFREKETDLNISRVPVEIRRSLAASNFFLVSRKNRTFALFPRPVHMELRNCFFFFFFFCSVVARASWFCRFIKFLYVFLSRLSRSTFSFFFSFSRPTCETSEKKLSSLRRVPNKASKINARNQPRLRRVPAREKIMVVILNRRSSVDLVARGGKHEGKREFPTGFGEISTSETWHPSKLRFKYVTYRGWMAEDLPWNTYRGIRCPFTR